MPGVERLRPLIEYPRIARNPWVTALPAVQGTVAVWCRPSVPTVWEVLGQELEYFGYPEKDSQIVHGIYCHSAPDSRNNGLYLPVMFSRQVREGTLHLQRNIADAYVRASDTATASVIRYATLSPLLRRRGTNHTYHNIFVYAYVHLKLSGKLINSYTHMLEVATKRGVVNANFLRDFYLQRLTMEVTLTTEDRSTPVRVTFKSTRKNVVSPTYI